MGFLKRANIEDVVRIETPDGEDWVELRNELSKGEVNKLVLVSPQDDKDRAGVLNFTERFAAMVVKRWSMVDEGGSPIPFTIDEYLKLSGEAAQWLDGVLVGHIQKTIGAEVKEIEGKPSN